MARGRTSSLAGGSGAPGRRRPPRRRRPAAAAAHSAREAALAQDDPRQGDDEQRGEPEDRHQRLDGSTPRLHRHDPGGRHAQHEQRARELVARPAGAPQRRRLAPAPDREHEGEVHHVARQDHLVGRVGPLSTRAASASTTAHRATKSDHQERWRVAPGVIGSAPAARAGAPRALRRSGRRGRWHRPAPGRRGRGAASVAWRHRCAAPAQGAHLPRPDACSSRSRKAASAATFG